MGFAGIKELIAVTQMQTANANNQAMEGATKQRALIRKEQMLHAAQAKLDEYMTAGKEGGINQTQENHMNALLDLNGVSSDLNIGTGGNGGGGDRKLNDAGSTQERANAASAQAVKDAMANKEKDYQNENKLGNFEIQGLMSDLNEAQTLASSVLKKLSETNTGVIGKI